MNPHAVQPTSLISLLRSLWRNRQLIIQMTIAEVINRAPTLITSNVNFVKKVVFPLEILPPVSIGAALFHSLVSLGVLMAAFLLFNGYLNWTIIFIPLVLLPLIILTLGVTWIVFVIFIIAATVVAWADYDWFQKIRKVFADVL